MTSLDTTLVGAHVYSAAGLILAGVHAFTASAFAFVIAFLLLAVVVQTTFFGPTDSDKA